MKLETLPLELAQPGMRLGTDIRDDQGAILLASGSKLTKPLLAALHRRGVSQVSVAEAEAPTEAEREAGRDAIRARLTYLFRRAGEAEADRILFEAMLDYRLEQLG